MVEYIIRNKLYPSEFWFKGHGWVEWDECTRFSEEQRNNTELPQDGEWCSDVTKILAMENTNA